MQKAREDIVIHTRKGITELTFAKKPSTDLENHFNIVELNNIEYVNPKSAQTANGVKEKVINQEV